MRGDLLWRSIPEMASDAARRFGAADAVVDGTRRASFLDLEADFRRVSAALLASGIARGDRVAVWAPNRYEWLVAALGALGAGAALVPVNTRFKRGEVAYILQRSRARVVFSVGEFLGTDYPAILAELRPQLPHLERVVGFDGAANADDSLESFVLRGEGVGSDAVDARLSEVRGDRSGGR